MSERMCLACWVKILLDDILKYFSWKWGWLFVQLAWNDNTIFEKKKKKKKKKKSHQIVICWIFPENSKGQNLQLLTPPDFPIIKTARKWLVLMVVLFFYVYLVLVKPSPLGASCWDNPRSMDSPGSGEHHQEVAGGCRSRTYCGKERNTGLHYM